MSILSAVLEGKETTEQGLTQAEQWLQTSLKAIAADLKGDPAVSAAVTTLASDGKAALGVAAEWAGTALSGELAQLADEAAALVVKYAPRVLGGANPLTAAGLTVLQALAGVGAAAIKHEVAALQAAAAPGA